MKLALAMGLTCVWMAAAQSPVAGTWSGNVHNVPGIRLTLNEDGGKLSGTVLFHLIRHAPDGSNGRVIGDSGTIDLRKLSFDGKKVTFEIDGSNKRPKVFEMVLDGQGEGRFREAGSTDAGVRMVRK
jgi:hypothetical protein